MDHAQDFQMDAITLRIGNISLEKLIKKNINQTFCTKLKQGSLYEFRDSISKKL